MLKRITLLFALLLAPVAALAQSSVIPYYVNSSGVKQVVGSSFPLPITGSFSATTTGFPTIQTTGTPISVTTGGVTGTLPTGAVVVASNVGTTNAAYCKLGASATTSDQYIAPSGGWFAFTVGANTQLTCITSTSTTTVNMVGGSGLPTGTGGGSGGSGGAITAASGSYASGALSSGSVASGAFASGSIGSGAVASGAIASGAVASGALAAGALAAGAGVDGWDLTQGAKGDAACAGGGSSCSVNARLAHIENLGAAALPAQTGIGNVNIGAVTNAGSKYIAVAAGATATVLQASAGAAGDYLSHCVLYPTAVTTGVVTVFDNTNTAATSAILFPGGTSALSNLAPISIPVGAVSTAGAWKVTTGSAISVVCYGKFS